MKIKNIWNHHLVSDWNQKSIPLLIDGFNLQVGVYMVNIKICMKPPRLDMARLSSLDLSWESKGPSNATPLQKPMVNCPWSEGRLFLGFFSVALGGLVRLGVTIFRQCTGLIPRTSPAGPQKAAVNALHAKSECLKAVSLQQPHQPPKTKQVVLRALLSCNCKGGSWYWNDLQITISTKTCRNTH